MIDLNRRYVELLIVALFALPIGAHGVVALFTHRIWVSPRNAKPLEMIGSSADLMGLGYLGLAAAMFAVWFTIRGSHRNVGLGLTGLCAIIAGAGFAAALLTR